MALNRQSQFDMRPFYQRCSPRDCEHSRPILCGLGPDTHGLGLEIMVSNVLNTPIYLAVYLTISLFLLEKNDSQEIDRYHYLLVSTFVS